MRKLVCAFSQSELLFHLLCFHPGNDFYHRSCWQQHWAPPALSLPPHGHPRPPGSRRLPGRRSASRPPPRRLRGGDASRLRVLGTLPGRGVPRRRAVPGVWLGAGCVPPAGRSLRSPQALRVHARLSDTDHRVPSSRDASRTWRDGEGLWRSAATGLCCAPSAAPWPRVWALLSKFIRLSKLAGKTHRSVRLCDQPHWAWKLDLTVGPCHQTHHLRWRVGRCPGTGCCRTAVLLPEEEGPEPGEPDGCACWGCLSLQEQRAGSPAACSTLATWKGGNQTVTVSLKWMADFCCGAEFN